MKILFFTHGQVSPTIGGTERITVSVASGLTKWYGHQCFSLFEQNLHLPKVDCFTWEKQLPHRTDGTIDEIRFNRIITGNHIDVIIIQGSFIHVKCFRKIIQNSQCKIIFAHHFEPGGESTFYTFKRSISFLLQSKHSLKNYVKKSIEIAIYPLMRKRYLSTLRANYRNAYFNADKVVLLSSKFISAYQHFAKLPYEESSNFTIIPNALSFDTFYEASSLSSKKKIALIVARLDDSHKKISVALRIWRKVKQLKNTDEWILKIVGDGRDYKKYINIISRHKIPDVQLLGKQPPVLYYREASIFLMTSKSEGWGLTLTEAQQTGCVPIAFHTYASLPEIINDGIDGIIIDKGNIEQYVDSLYKLMMDVNYRTKLAQQGLQTCCRFEQKKVIKKWNDLIISISK